MWLDIFSIPQFHDGCKLLAVNFHCYAAAADDLIILHGLLSCSLLSWFAVIYMGKTYVWLGIFSIPQFHDGCKLLAVRPFYVYAAAEVGLINVAWISELFIADIVCQYTNGKDIRVKRTSSRFHNFITVVSSLLSIPSMSTMPQRTDFTNVASVSVLFIAGIVCRYMHRKKTTGGWTFSRLH